MEWKKSYPPLEKKILFSTYKNKKGDRIFFLGTFFEREGRVWFNEIDSPTAEMLCDEYEWLDPNENS